MASRGASWVGDIYQRFEAMCLEVEETLNEDAVKFIERQVQNVGTNVKKFYLDIMQDLVSQDSTSVKLPVTEFPRDSENQVSENLGRESLVSEIVDECASTEHIVLTSPQDSVVEGWKWESEEDEKEMASYEENDADITIKDTLTKSTALGDSKISQLTSELVASSVSGSISKCDKDMIGSNDSTDQKMKKAKDGDIELDETCVFVNENNISFVSYKDAKPRSYKKKIKEAFSLKKKSIRQEYKKLVRRYEDVNVSSSLTCVDAVAPTLPTLSSTPELQTREFQESDWEVL
ncbi:uncharacterized protein LOC141693260 isoform X2 [Apium graveolens]|uniref:uncharacterized protein LOC141693260 isoform X2 n=1 Tax=Apium graveolens TaxID=4045 RepID=UPI003D7B2990